MLLLGMLSMSLSPLVPVPFPGIRLLRIILSDGSFRITGSNSYGIVYLGQIRQQWLMSSHHWLDQCNDLSMLRVGAEVELPQRLSVFQLPWLMTNQRNSVLYFSTLFSQEYIFIFHHAWLSFVHYAVLCFSNSHIFIECKFTGYMAVISMQIRFILVKVYTNI